MGKNSGSGYGTRNRDEQPRSYFQELRNHFFGVKILKFFDADPGWKNFGSGSGINTSDPQHSILECWK
jgi:hypothetical protein